MAEQARFESAEDAKELVATEVQNQLAKVGTFTAKYNRAAGELTSAFYSTLGDKLGISAKKLLTVTQFVLLMSRPRIKEFHLIKVLTLNKQSQ